MVWQGKVWIWNRSAMYHIDRVVQETGGLFGDEAHILYVNAQIKDSTALGQLMHDFSCTSAAEMHYPILADRVRYFKEEQEGVATMSRVFEEIARKAEQEKAIKVARRMLTMGKYSYEEISALLDLSVEEIKALDESRTA